ncbi:hypothetical protein K8D42_02455 [Citrobacter portucalensis]|uniref:hypothetical protein n=1 Tax=Citrobacter portucalensis TaxID=1639133 RepID=UPI00207CD63E|nr:hypothetical protein [Citrobacter portucalensis]MCO4135176.1 hypothetical protein [Citrobacter portucalensis]MCO4152765.1 hypothetical protein [Citrobacter portucalensis]
MNNGIKAKMYLSMVLLTGCVPYPHQLALVTEPVSQYGLIAGSPVTDAPLPLFNVSNLSGLQISNVLCFAPSLYDPVQGQIGSLIWMRHSALEFEVESVNRPGLSSESLISINDFIRENRKDVSVLIACPIQIIRITPLVDLTGFSEVSFASGRDGGGGDIFVIRIRASGGKHKIIEKMLQSQTGILFQVDYRVEGLPEIYNAVLRLRSGTKNAE